MVCKIFVAAKLMKSWLTAGEDVYAELDRWEVTVADLVAQLVEADAFAKCYFTQTSLVTGQLVR